MRPTLTLAAVLSVLALAACQPTTTSSDSSNPNVGITTHSTVVSGSGQSAAAAAPTTAAAAPAGPAVVLKVSGNGIKNTKQFTTGENWTIAYTYDCSKIYGGNGNFQVYVDYPNGDIPINELGAKGSSSSTASGAGTHTLKVASECPWTITVTNG